MPQKTDNQLLDEISNKFTSGSDKWTGQEVEDSFIDLIHSKSNKSDAVINVGVVSINAIQIRPQSQLNVFNNGTQPAIVIGISATADDDVMTTQLGNFSSSLFTDEFANYPGNNTVNGPEKTVIGHGAVAPAWRGTSIGAKALAGAVSCLSIGVFSWGNTTHGIQIGKAAVNLFDPSEGFLERTVIGDHTNPHVYFGNGQAHKYPPHPLTGNNETGDYIPANTMTTIHGHDAKDLRDNPSDFNVAGGHLRLAAGVSTGTGAPGRVSLASASVLQGNPGGNIKRQLWDFIVVDGQEDTNGMLGITLNLNGIQKRIKVGSPNSAGAGFRTLSIEN